MTLGRYIFIFVLQNYPGRRTIPLKPINAIASIPAEISAIGIPRKATGSSVRASCSRIPAKTTRASVKPKAVDIA